MIEHDDKSQMQPPQSTKDVMKGAPAPDAANPGGASQVADPASGVGGDTPDAGIVEGGTPVPNTDQEAG